MSGCEGLAGLVPLLLLGERKAAQKIQLRRLAFRTLRQLRGFFPQSEVKGFLRGGKARCLRRGLLRKGRRGEREQKEKEDQFAATGTARSIQFRAACHSFSNSCLSMRKSFPRAGSLTKTASRSQSIPVTTT